MLTVMVTENEPQRGYLTTYQNEEGKKKLKTKKKPKKATGKRRHMKTELGQFQIIIAADERNHHDPDEATAYMETRSSVGCIAADLLR